MGANSQMTLPPADLSPPGRREPLHWSASGGVPLHQVRFKLHVGIQCRVRAIEHQNFKEGTARERGFKTLRQFQRDTRAISNE